MKIWDKGFPVDQKIERFTVGNDRLLDVALAEFDIVASMAHANMLQHVGLLTKEELSDIQKVLQQLLQLAKEGTFRIDDDVEDVHSQIEKILIQEIGDTGKKIHVARSRNDQVFTALLLFSKNKIQLLGKQMDIFFQTLMEKAHSHQHILMPGYTHTQIAMPSSFGLWFSAYAEMLAFDMELLAGAYTAIDVNPLGSAAGYGSSFPIQRKMTTQQLQFSDLLYSSSAAQLLRGKAEWSIVSAIGSLALTINKLASDVCLFNSQNFNLISLPVEFTTGSSIMPHKKNPDVFELIRARTNRILAAQNELLSMISNLISGYHRDFQLTKDTYMRVWEDIDAVVDLAEHAIRHCKVHDVMQDNKLYDQLFTVENIANLVNQGVPFRDAYKQIATTIEQGTFQPHKTIQHTHEGSISRLCLENITQKFQRAKQKISQ